MTSTTMMTTQAASMTSASAQGVIKMGLITPLSGIYAPDGTQVQQGAQMAADQLNAAGGVMGQQVQILPQDEGGTTADTVNAAQILVNQQNVNFMMGPYFSGDVRATLPITTAAKIAHQAYLLLGGNVKFSGEPSRLTENLLFSVFGK